MTRIHFIDGFFLDIGLDIKTLNDILDKSPNVKFLHGETLTIVLNNVTYMESIQVDA